MKRALPTLISLVVVWVLYCFRANVWFRLYPVIVVAFAWMLFVVSLFRTPLVEIVARRLGEPLDARDIVYCRTLTRIWVGFLTVHFAVTLTTVFLSEEIWVFYNGFLSGVLMGILFIGEWLYRRRMRRG